MELLHFEVVMAVLQAQISLTGSNLGFSVPHHSLLHVLQAREERTSLETMSTKVR